ncbi:MAG TPA: pitrilysin family protein, partial [Candidatus Cloacimonadota bacterium]|nr:pitrilysin family protein [Candidatus Cloacimonadota bacterium]
PIVHCITVAKVGSVNEEPGKTGIAHILEHMAFKGTTTIGTSDYTKEQKLNNEADAIFSQILAAKKSNASKDKIDDLQKKLDAKDKEASDYIVPNEFSEIIQRNGGTDLNAGTMMDMTIYQISYPSNRLELWMAMETDRFTNPVFREFYKERDVIIEEKRMRYDNSPQGKLISDIADSAFTVHPYKHPTIGYQEDLESVTRQDVYDFFNKYYGAANLIFTVYGDVKAADVKSLADKYLSTIPKRTPVQDVAIVEPPQTSERSYVIKENAQPMFFMAYHVPAEISPESPALDALVNILGQSQTSRLTKSLVEDKKVSVGAFAFKGYPGSKYPNLLLIGAVPSPGHTIQECKDAIEIEINKMKNEPVTQKELQGYQKRTQLQNVQQLNGGLYLAMQLGYYEALEGDYSQLFNEFDKTKKVTPEQIKAAAKKYLVDTNKTVAEMVTKGE